MDNLVYPSNVEIKGPELWDYHRIMQFMVCVISFVCGVFTNENSIH